MYGKQRSFYEDTSFHFNRYAWREGLHNLWSTGEKADEPSQIFEEMMFSCKMTTGTRGPSWRPMFVVLLSTALHSYQGFAFSPLQRQVFQTTRGKHRRGRQTASSCDTTASTTLHMALTPTGPFCPFRSSATQAMEPRMENLNSATPEFAVEMERIQLDMQTGNTPDPDRLRKAAKGIDEAVDEWEGVLTRLKLSNDFQTREYAKLNQAHLETYGMTTEGVASIMRWQSGCMRAMADNTPPPMPPPDLDLMKMIEQSQNTEQKQPPSITSMTSAEKITSNPFTGEEDVFDSPTVREEYERLCEDHAGLIEMGGSYANFDPAGKIAYLNEIEKIEDRWQVFFARFKLLGKLNKDFIRQCNDFLASMGMDEEQFQELLKKTHQIMREDAEKERNLMGL